LKKKKGGSVVEPAGISADEFFQLSETRILHRGKPTKELLDFLTGPQTTKGVADFLGITVSAAYSRLVRLKKAGYVQVRYSDKTAYWLGTGKALEE